jgi:hypothetical protein
VTLIAPAWSHLRFDLHKSTPPALYHHYVLCYWSLPSYTSAELTVNLVTEHKTLRLLYSTLSRRADWQVVTDVSEQFFFNGSTALVGLGRFFSYLIYAQSVGLLGWGISERAQTEQTYTHKTSMP